MIRLIVNADDFGLCRGVNYGILDSHLYGILNSTTMMMNTPGTEHAIALAKQTPSLKVGIHLVLTCGKPLSGNVPSLVGKEGAFHTLPHAMQNKDLLDLEEVEKEWTAQIEKFLQTGLKPTHLDSHHHIHTWEELLPVVQRLSITYGLPVRANGHEHLRGVTAFTDICLLDFYGHGVREDYFQNLPKKVGPDTTVEVMCHPAYVDTYLMKESSYNLHRLKELEILIQTKLSEAIELV